ncbi:MAG: transporter [Phycisphaerales bacterium]|nr:transporter [Phycisphaerales bacterium]
MSGPVASALSILLVTAAILAEINLLRVLINDGRESRRTLERRRLRQTQTCLSMAVAARPVRAAACAAALTLAAPALAQTPPPSTGPVLPSASAPQTPLAGNAASPKAVSAASTAASIKRASPELTISTDRPSFSDTAGIAPVGHLQLETGYTFTLRDRDGIETQRHNGPELLARVGLIDDRFELRLSTSGYVWSRSGDDTGSGFRSTEGWSDFSLGFKLKLTDQDGAIPRLALGAATTTGAGSDGISSRRAEPTVKLIWSYDLEKLGGDSLKGFGVYGNINASWTTSDGDRFWQGAASICGTYAISDRWGVFAEYYTVFPAGQGTGPSHSVDFGTTYLLTPRIQLDARVGFGLNSKADNVFMGIGLSILF